MGGVARRTSVVLVAALLVERFVACLERAGADPHTSDERPPSDDVYFKAMTRSEGFLESIDAWRAEGTGFYMKVYRSHAQAQAAIDAQHRADVKEGQAGINADLTAKANVAVQPSSGDEPDPGNTRELDRCIIAASAR
jgi:hypothetical protein